jgi:hypothetical protein
MESNVKTANAVSVSTFEEALSKTSSMPLYQKRERTSYDYFKKLGESLSESLKAGTSPLLPNKDGIVDLKPAYNINTNKTAEGLTQLCLLEKQAELKAPTAAFVTYDTVKKAQDAGVECKILKGSKGVVIPVVDEKDWGKIEFKNTWFNVSQIENAERLVDFCKENMTKEFNKKVQYINEHYPDSAYNKPKNPAEKNMAWESKITEPLGLNKDTKEPFLYIAQVFNAVQSGRKLYVSPEQAAAFKEKAVQLLTAEYEPGKLDVAAIKKITNSAENLYLKNKKHLQEYSKNQNQEHKKTFEKKPRSRSTGYERSY